MDKSKVSNTANRPALGKGLASLIPGAGGPPSAPMGEAPAETRSSTQESESSRDRHPGISMAAIEEITPNNFQPRKSFDDQTIEELAQSIKMNGLIQPLIVRRAARGYQLIAGERRLRAAKAAGLKQVPIVVRRTTDREALELALIENIQREDLNCIDTALAYYQLVQDFDLKQDEISDRVGKDRASISNYLRILKLPLKVQNDLRGGELSFGHGKALLALDDADTIEIFALETIEKKWSVRELETQIQNYKDSNAPKKIGDAAAVKDPRDPVKLRLRNLGRDLSAKLSTKVQVKGSAAKGKIVIEYFNGDDLDRLLNRLMQ